MTNACVAHLTGRGGRSILARMGNPFVHLDLAADDVGAAKKFYKRVFDWKFTDFPDMKWTGIDVGQGVGGGIGKKQMPKQPTAWTAYVDVKDVKKTIAKAKKAGARIVVPFMTVGTMGCLGIFTDPQGATIGVWQTLKQDKKAAKNDDRATKKAAVKKTTAKKVAKAKDAKTVKSGKKAAKKAAKAKGASAPKRARAKKKSSKR